VIKAIERLMEYETAGDPMTGLKWTHKTTEKISGVLQSVGIEICPQTVARLLRAQGFSLRVNSKQVSRVTCPHRDQQFRYIKRLRDAFARDDLPIVSIDTKKKELIGQFKNAGRAWSKQAIAVNDHDFRSDGKGMAVPYGILDVRANRGYIVVGMSHDTAEFAVSSLAHWWKTEGRKRYPTASSLLVLADNGGSNGSRVRAWKHAVQTQLCDALNLSVTICHYPPGTSKWNPIEHRLFSQVSNNLAGRPLDSYETLVNYISTTSTKTGLRVKASLDRGHYQTGVKITDDQMAAIQIDRHKILPDWNYTIRPTG
jgi:hypothetical protein